MNRAVLAVVVLTLVTACSGRQTGGTPRVSEIRGDTVGLKVMAGDQLLPVFFIDGKYYLLGKSGANYELGLTNHSESRVEIVVSVDGRDVITGQSADFRKQRGYVLMPGEEVSIEGFRRSLNDVAAFEFSSVEDSYAAQVGDKANVGVIGVAIFEEKPQKESEAAIAREQTLSSPPKVSMMADDVREAKEDDRGLGTYYGETVASPAEIVPFKRLDAEQPGEVIALLYDDMEGLESAGVVFSDGSDTIVVSKPDPFPGVPDKNKRFAPQPSR